MRLDIIHKSAVYYYLYVIDKKNIASSNTIIGRNKLLKVHQPPYLQFSCLKGHAFISRKSRKL